MFLFLQTLEKWEKAMRLPKGSGARLPIEFIVLLFYSFVIYLAFQNNVKPTFEVLMKWTCYWMAISVGIITIRLETLQQLLVRWLESLLEQIKPKMPK